MGFWVTYVNILIHVAYINKEAYVYCRVLINVYNYISTNYLLVYHYKSFISSFTNLVN